MASPTLLRYDKLVIPATFLLLTLGCHHSSRVQKSSPRDVAIPGWVLRTPNDPDNLYAVGISGPTFFAEDAKHYAADQARKELAKAIAGKVTSFMLMIQQSRGNTADEGFLVSATSWATDLVLHNSQILELWVDKQGSIQGSTQGTTYALCAIDRQLVDAGIPRGPEQRVPIDSTKH